MTNPPMQDHAIFRRALDYGLAHLASLENRRPFPSQAALDALRIFDEPMPLQGADADSILRQLHDIGSPATVAHGGGRYFGFVNGGALPAGLAARALADFWDQNAALHVMSPIAAKLEALCEGWLVDLLRLPDGTAAGFVGGSSTATLCGLLAGRDALLRRHGWDIREGGLFGAPAIRVVMSQEAHATVSKALAILGIGDAQIERIPADSQGRFDADRLPKLDDNTLLILQAGNVNSGAFDDFAALCQAARDADAWTHIDGAFGLWARACNAKAHLTHGIEMADSWSVDAHKTLNSPYDCGIVFCRESDALAAALQVSGAYLPLSGERDGSRYTPDMSRRARGIELWALLKSLGKAGIDALVTRLCAHARDFADGLAAQGFRILNDVVFNQVLVACETGELTEATLKQIQRGGEIWCGGTLWHGEPAIRVSVCSHATTADDIRRGVEAFAQARSLALRQVK